ncbi:hypothetical protein KIPB_011540, partial [Kipferlia bialata]
AVFRGSQPELAGDYLAQVHRIISATQGLSSTHPLRMQYLLDRALYDMHMQKFKKAGTVLTELLSIQKTLHKEHPTDSRVCAALARTHVLLASVESGLHRPALSVKHLRHSVTLYTMSGMDQEAAHSKLKLANC